MNDTTKVVLVTLLVVLVVILGYKQLESSIKEKMAASNSRPKKVYIVKKIHSKQPCLKPAQKAPPLCPEVQPAPKPNAPPAEPETRPYKNQSRTRSLYCWNSVMGGGVRMEMLCNNTRLLTIRDIYGNDYSANLGQLSPEEATRIFAITKSRAEVSQRLTPEKAERVLDYAIQVTARIMSEMDRNYR